MKALTSFVACLCAYTFVAQDQSAESWLFDMHKAIHVRPYVGDLFYQHGRDYMTLRLQLDHNEEGHIQTEIIRTDYPSIEVESRNIRLSYLQDAPSDQLSGLGPGIQTIPGLGDWLEDCQDHYTFKEAGKERVAGRNTVVIKIEPHTTDRNQMRMWLDEKTAVPLRVEVREPLEPYRVLESMSFTNVRIEPVDPRLAELYEASVAQGDIPFATNVQVQTVEMAEIQPSQPAEAAEESIDPCLRTQNNCWRLGYIPAGFSLSTSSGIQSETGYDGLMMFHTDGVTSFSVFIQQSAKEPVATEVIQRGSTLVVSRSVLTDETHYLISTVGDIPEETAVRITESISFLE